MIHYHYNETKSIGCRFFFKSNCPLVGPGTNGGMLSVGVFLRKLNRNLLVNVIISLNYGTLEFLTYLTLITRMIEILIKVRRQKISFT